MEKQKAALYCRMGQNVDLDIAVEQMECQKQLVKDYAQKYGLTVAQYYGDIGVSGWEKERMGLKCLIKDAAEKKFQLVLVSAFDRFWQGIPESGEKGIQMNVYSIEEDALFTVEI